MTEHEELQRPPVPRTTLAGSLLAGAGSVILMGVITAEALYPARYTTFDNEISDLGATKPPDSVILQPSATIFNVTMMVSGLAITLAAVLLLREGVRRFFGVAVLLTGVGVLGVGVFPGNVGSVHPWFALLAFVAGGLAGIASYYALPGPVGRFAGVLGAVSFVALLYALFAGLDAPVAKDLGDGGIERWVAYPVVLWMVLLGGALMSRVAGRRCPSEVRKHPLNPSKVVQLRPGRGRLKRFNARLALISPIKSGS